MATGQPLERLPARGVSGVAFSPDGRHIAVGTDEIYEISFRSYEESLDWIQNNRYIPEFTCEERILYQIDPLCAEDGSYPTRTPYPSPTPGS